MVPCYFGVHEFIAAIAFVSKPLRSICRMCSAALLRYSKTMAFLNSTTGGDGSIVKSTYCSCKGPGDSSQNPPDGLQSSTTPVPGYS